MHILEKGRGLVLCGILIRGSLFAVSLRRARQLALNDNTERR
jgi:hypothetical protein